MSFLKKFLKLESHSQDDTLVEAIKNDNLKKVTALLNIEDINKEDEDFKTPLVFALNHSSLNVTKFLIENGANLEETLEGNSIISHLIKVNASIEMLDYMRSIGASTIYEYGQSPLEMAIKTASSFKTFKYIFENFGINIPEGKKYLIHEIADSENIDFKTKVKLLELLVKEYDFDINEDESELHLSSKLFNKRDFELLAEVIKLGACVNSVASNLLTFMGEKKVKELSSHILKYPINNPKYILEILDFDTFKEYILNTNNINGILLSITKSTMLHDKQKIQLAKIALEKGANINELTTSDHPTNVLYTFTSHFDIGKNTLYLDFLLDNGAKIEDNGFSALFTAIMENDISLVKHLLNKGADVNFVNYFDNTAINFIISPKAKFNNVQEKIKMFELLIENGLDMNIKLSHYQNSGSNYTPAIEAIIDISESEFVEYVLEKFPNIEINDTVIRYAITRDIDINVAKKIIAYNPYVIFENEKYSKIKEKYYDSGILEMAIDNEKEELVNHILDTYSDVKSYGELVSLVIKAIYSKFSINTIKRVISIDPDLNRLYYVFSDDPHSETTLIRFLRSCHEYLTQEQRVEILRELVKYNADIYASLTKLEATKSNLDNVGILVQQALNNVFEPKVLEFFLESGFDPYKPTANLNESQMHSLINRFGQVSDESCIEYLEFFKEKGFKVDFEHKNVFDTDILLGAAMMNRPKTIKWLIDHGANVHVIGGFDNSPALHKAISNYDNANPMLRAKTVKVLIEAGCDIEQIDSEQFTPLMSAANYGCFESVRVLLEAKANPNFFNEAGESAVHRAILGEVKAYDDKENSNLVRSKILAVLKDTGADLNQSSNEVLPALHLSIIRDKKDIFNTLLQLDLDLNALDMLGRTPLMVAIAYGDIYYVNRLMNNKKIKLDIVDNNNESIHFSAVIRSDTSMGLKMLKYFIEKKVPLTNGAGGFTLLHTAGYYANFKAIDILKEFFPDFNIKDSQGFTPLHWTVYSNIDIEQDLRIQMIRELVENKANINERLPNGENALTLAVYAGFKDVSDELISLGCDIQVALNTLENIEGVPSEAIEYLKSRI